MRIALVLVLWYLSFCPSCLAVNPTKLDKLTREQLAISKAIGIPNDSLVVASWPQHPDGYMGGHYNFTYNQDTALIIDDRFPRKRYGKFRSLHFHHALRRVHMDFANPYADHRLLAPIHLFVDVLGGHLCFHRSAVVGLAATKLIPRP
jgi:hypothetical protein